MLGWITTPLAIIAGDGAAKRWAETNLSDGKTKTVCGGRIRLQLFHNDGVVLGALKKEPKLILVINGLLLGAAFGEYLRLIREKKDPAAKVGLALLMGGGASNLMDRLKRGYVTDYFSFETGEKLKKLRNIVFNVSDFCVFAGLFCYLLGKTEHSSKEEG